MCIALGEADELRNGSHGSSEAERRRVASCLKLSELGSEL